MPNIFQPIDIDTPNIGIPQKLWDALVARALVADKQHEDTLRANRQRLSIETRELSSSSKSSAL